MSDHPNTHPGDDRVVALSREIDRARREAETATREVGELRDLVRRLAGDFATLARAVAGNGSPEEGTSRAWLQVSDPDVAREVLVDLVGWVDAVYLRYRGAQLPSCWALHPWVIEELWWLRNTHTDAYTGKTATWAKAGDWHDRLRPGVARRINEAIGTCAVVMHQRGEAQEPRARAAPLAGHLDDIADAWTSTGLPPVPTAVQLDEARQYDAKRK